MKKFINKLMAIAMNLQLFADAGTLVNATGNYVNAYTGDTTAFDATNSLSGEHIGTYLGLFNGTICLPQIVAAACGGLLLKAVGGAQVNMFIVAGVLLVLGAVSVYFIKAKK